MSLELDEREGVERRVPVDVQVPPDAVLLAFIGCARELEELAPADRRRVLRALAELVGDP